MEWVSSGGGPLMLLDEQLLSAWGGAFGLGGDESRSALGKGTDYDRACQVRDYVGVIPVGHGQGLVLSGEALETTWYSQPHHAGEMLVRWVYAEDDESVERALNSLPADIPWTDGPNLDVSGRYLVLFDSAMEGTDILIPPLRVELAPGRYRILTTQYMSGSDTSLLLHRLAPVAG
jgi:hypothetical protein